MSARMKDFVGEIVYFVDFVFTISVFFNYNVSFSHIFVSYIIYLLSSSIALDINSQLSWWPNITSPVDPTANASKQFDTDLA